MNRFGILVVIGTLFISACSDKLDAQVVVVNVDTVPGNNITTVYLVEDCADGWGSPVATGLNIPAAAASQALTVESESFSMLPPIPGAEGDSGGNEIQFSVRACFSSGTCGEITELSVEADDTKHAYLKDDGDSEIPTYCVK